MGWVICTNLRSLCVLLEFAVFRVVDWELSCLFFTWANSSNRKTFTFRKMFPKRVYSNCYCILDLKLVTMDTFVYNVVSPHPSNIQISGWGWSWTRGVFADKGFVSTVQTVLLCGTKQVLISTFQQKSTRAFFSWLHVLMHCDYHPKT